MTDAREEQMLSARPCGSLRRTGANQESADAVDEVVSDLLDPPSDASTEQHAILLRLSGSAAGRPQIVTTNFDLLFERVDPSLTAAAIVAPALPDLAHGVQSQCCGPAADNEAGSARSSGRQGMRTLLVVIAFALPILIRSNVSVRTS